MQQILLIKVQELQYKQELKWNFLVIANNPTPDITSGQNQVSRVFMYATAAIYQTMDNLTWNYSIVG